MILSGTLFIFQNQNEVDDFQADHDTPAAVVPLSDEIVEDFSSFVICCGRHESQAIAESVYRQIIKVGRDYARYDEEDECYYGSEIKILSIHQISEPEKNFKKADLWMPPLFETMNFNSLSQIEIKDEPLIDGILKKRGSLVLVGAAGCGKSTIRNMMALEGAAGLSVFGKFKVEKPVKILILQAENSHETEGQRVKSLLMTRPELKPGAENVSILKFFNDRCQVTGGVDDPDFQNQILAHGEKINPDIIFLDPWASFNPVSENSNDDVRRVLENFQKTVCWPLNAALVLIHHSGNNGKLRGASSLKDWTEALISIERKSKDTIKIKNLKNRNYLEFNSFQMERDGFSFEPVENQKDDVQIQAVKAAMISLGGRVEKQSILVDAVMDKMNCKITSAKNAIHAAVDAGIVKSSSSDETKIVGYYLK